MSIIQSRMPPIELYEFLEKGGTIGTYGTLSFYRQSNSSRLLCHVDHVCVANKERPCPHRSRQRCPPIETVGSKLSMMPPEGVPYLIAFAILKYKKGGNICTEYTIYQTIHEISKTKRPNSTKTL
jgi:hypothetical protein